MGIIAKWFEAATLKADYTREEVSADVYSRLGALESSMTTAESDIAALETQALGGDSLSQQAIDDISDMKWDDVPVTLDQVQNYNKYRVYTMNDQGEDVLLSIKLRTGADSDLYETFTLFLPENGVAKATIQYSISDNINNYIMLSVGGGQTTIISNAFDLITPSADDLIVKRRKTLP